MFGKKCKKPAVAYSIFEIVDHLKNEALNAG